MNIAPAISRIGVYLAAALLMLCNATWAQEADPAEYQVQGLWRNHDKDSLFPSKAYQRLYYGASVGTLAVSDRVSTRSQAVFNAYAGYRFSPIHSLRLNLGYSRLNVPDKFRGAPSLGLGVDYVASLSDFIAGYNPKRIVDFSTVIGLGGRITRYTGKTKLSPYVQLGMNIDRKSVV